MSDKTTGWPWETSSPIEAWKERNLRRVDIGGMSVMVLGEPAMQHLEAFRRRTTKMEMALHWIVNMAPEWGQHGAQEVAKKGLSHE